MSYYCRWMWKHVCNDVLTFPSTVRQLGSNSGCSSLTTPTQPYSYKSSSSLLLHRPKGCIWKQRRRQLNVWCPIQSNIYGGQRCVNRKCINIICKIIIESRHHYTTGSNSDSWYCAIASLPFTNCPTLDTRLYNPLKTSRYTSAKQVSQTVLAPRTFWNIVYIVLFLAYFLSVLRLQVWNLSRLMCWKLTTRTFIKGNLTGDKTLLKRKN